MLVTFIVLEIGEGLPERRTHDFLNEKQQQKHLQLVLQRTTKQRRPFYGSLSDESRVNYFIYLYKRESYLCFCVREAKAKQLLIGETKLYNTSS